jgi:predicted deacetylase
MYLVRLDDASEYLEQKKWDQIEIILDRYAIKPIVGVIPNNRDPKLVSMRETDHLFWEKVVKWQKKGWTIAMHGFDHVYITKEGGINPVNNKSEFAGVSLEMQIQKINSAWKIFESHNIEPKIFFAPSHTYDLNTLIALKSETPIRIISDSVANDSYCENGFYFIPQQIGHARKLPFRIVTFCLHPNIMSEEDFEKMERFFKKNKKAIGKVGDIILKDKAKSPLDNLLSNMYFLMRKVIR